MAEISIGFLSKRSGLPIQRCVIMKIWASYHLTKQEAVKGGIEVGHASSSPYQSGAILYIPFRRSKKS